MWLLAEAVVKFCWGEGPRVHQSLGPVVAVVGQMCLSLASRLCTLTGTHISKSRQVSSWASGWLAWVLVVASVCCVGGSWGIWAMDMA